MKKTLFFMAFMLMTSTLGLNAQIVVFEETFESTAEMELPVDWEVVNRTADYSFCGVSEGSADTDLMGFSGHIAAMINYDDSSDQLLVSPAIELQAGESFSLNFLIGARGIPMFPPHYAVYVLPETESFTGSEAPLLEENIETVDVALPKTIDLSEYAGQRVRIYFRQYNSSRVLGTAIFLDTIQIIQQDHLGTSEVGQRSAIGIYPNPASDYVYLKSKSKITNAEVYDMTGRKMNIKAENERLDVRALQPGNYIIITESENKRSSHKLIKK